MLGEQRRGTGGGGLGGGRQVASVSMVVSVGTTEKVTLKRSLERKR